jgi:hypothetical protein
LHKAALGLARHDHIPGMVLETTANETATLHWTQTQNETEENLDFHRVTEDAAEAIALTFVKLANHWTILRRAQRDRFADWLMIDAQNKPVALEISGVNMIDQGQRRLREKAEQVGRHPDPAAIKAACVVELSVPRCRLIRV